MRTWANRRRKTVCRTRRYTRISHDTYADMIFFLSMTMASIQRLFCRMTLRICFFDRADGRHGFAARYHNKNFTLRGFS